MGLRFAIARYNSDSPKRYGLQVLRAEKVLPGRSLETVLWEKEISADDCAALVKAGVTLDDFASAYEGDFIKT